MTCSGLLLLLHPVAGAVHQVQPSMRVHALSLHALEGAGDLIDSPIALAGDEAGTARRSCGRRKSRARRRARSRCRHRYHCRPP